MFIIYCISCVWTSVFAQSNLVPNASFEERICCPSEVGQHFCGEHWDILNTSVEYLHLCITDSILGYFLDPKYGELPRTDSAMAGLYLDFVSYREYLSIELSETLKNDSVYCFSVYFSPYSHCQFFIDRFEFLVSDYIPTHNVAQYPALIYSNEHHTIYPGIMSNTNYYHKLEYSFVANGGERHLTMGLFSPKDSIERYPGIPNTLGGAYYILDDVALYKCNSPVEVAKAGPDKYVCQGDNTMIGTHNLPEYRYYWYQDTNLISKEARPFVSPDSTTTYVLKVKDFKFDETTDTVTVFVVDCDTLPRACAGNTQLICLGDTVQIGCPSIPNYTYQWMKVGDTAFASGAKILVHPSHNTSYVVKATSYANSISYDTVLVEVINCNNIFADAGKDSTICLGDTLWIGNTAIYGAEYAWYRSGSFFDSAASIMVSPSQTTTYLLQVSDPRKTIYEDWCTIEVQVCDIPLNVPNVFTPNGDGINDFFQIENPENAAYELFIFNRWGALILETNHDKLWDGTVDGKPVASGTYFYSLTATLPPYRTTRLQGTVMVLRGQ